MTRHEYHRAQQIQNRETSRAGCPNKKKMGASRRHSVLRGETVTSPQKTCQNRHIGENISSRASVFQPRRDHVHEDRCCRGPCGGCLRFRPRPGGCGPGDACSQEIWVSIAPDAGRREARCCLWRTGSVEPVSGSSGRAAHAWTASSSRAWAQPGPQKQRLRLGKIVIASSSAGRLLQEGTWGSECSRRGTHTSAAMGTHAGMQDVANVARWCAGAHTDVRVCLSVFLSVAGSPASAALPAT